MQLKHLSALVAAATSTSASPIVNNKLTVNQVEVDRYMPRIGAVEMKKTYAKYNAPVPDHVLVAADTQSGSVYAYAQSYDSAYLCPVTIGGQSFNLDFDTGSSDLWVFSTLMPSSESSGHDTYDPSQSGTEEDGESWEISYGDGSGASGVVYADTVVIGGVTATGQAVEAATSVSAQFEGQSADGLVGLAWPSINTCQSSQCTPFFQTVAGDLPDQVFAASLKHDATGSYDFGYIDSSKYSGDLTYVSIDNSNGFWEFTADGYAISGSTTDESMDVIADTGTSLMYLPTDVISAYWANVDGATDDSSAGGWIFDCDATLPDFGVTVSGVTFTVAGAYMNFQPYQGSQCFGGLQDQGSMTQGILGDVFLKNVYVVFDVGNVQLGLAPQA